MFCRRFVVFFIVLSLCVLIDQVSKYLVQLYEWDVVFNTGVAWGLGSELVGFYWAPVFVLIVLLGYLYTIWKGLDRIEVVGWGLIVGGAVSNVLDRMWLGAVVDWVEVFRWFPWFNIADVSINLGLFTLLFESLRGKER